MNVREALTQRMTSSGPDGETYERRIVVDGGSFAVFAVRKGDSVTVTDPEGCQPGEVFVIPERDAGASALFDAPRGRSLAAVLAEAGDAMASVHNLVASRGIDAARFESEEILSGETVAGASISARAAGDALVVIHASGQAMAPDAQNPPTRLLVDLVGTRGAPRPGANDIWNDLPEPLAPVKAEFRIDAATATAYRVAEGDYVQIIDVAGRQCSDFVAFDAAALADGHEIEIDATTTRTLMGATAPGPGLHSKYFDARMRPMVETIRDTVGRHDTFLLACSPKYYEDMGYPGHDNCTDNFNRALAEHAVKPRAGWPAINFFYNTFVGDDDAIGLDEPWSRPGDYVLLRAMTDLVCASSSCADDVDPANAWNPTDIHVRIYDKDCEFSKGVAHRMTPTADPVLTRQSGFHARTSQLTRNFVEYRGFWLPTCFTNEGPVAEYWACRERAVIMDLSALRKFEVTGPDAEALMQLAATRNIKKLAVGQVVYTAMCFETGGMIDDGTVFRLGPQNFRWICGDEFCGVWLRELAQKNGFKVWVRSSTDQLHNVAVQGPKSREILKDIVFTPPHQPSLAELKWFRFTIGRVGGPQGVPVVVSRTGYTGELGYEVWCHPTRAPEVWDAIAEAGKPFGLRPFGLSALDMVRIESGLVFAGYDFCDQTDPFEAGIGFTVPADQPDDYVGRAALERRRANPHRKLVGLEFGGNETINHGDCVYAGRAQVGLVTSATRSPILGKTIALARLDVAAAEIGGKVEVGKLDGHQKRLPATIVPFPHFDPEKTRVRV
ncbi:Glycine cleavage system T protein [Beijerinckiaceae bacterium RH AL1]|nr:Glycine cleavage system T protein [Beijerinckiaceae bacterium RH CH11]VVB49438.1 Glycine cleavage system T protein [Beijerinckiaceae bacterium RH AL8]VVC56862.1 Glycine cleavage system T protein [Beijerinckiaceae bacterium RH AL1]